MLGESKNQFPLTCAALSTDGHAKNNFLSVAASAGESCASPRDSIRHDFTAQRALVPLSVLWWGQRLCPQLYKRRWNIRSQSAPKTLGNARTNLVGMVG